MDAPPFALVMARNSTVYAAHSADPDAPVVEDRGPHVRRTRELVADVLSWMARAIEPSRGARREAPCGVGHAAT
jgi:hypothetical protein